MVFNVTFNNISVLSWWSVLLMKETEVSGKKNTDMSLKTLSHNVESSTPRYEGGSNSQNFSGDRH
jgi:hypothetical protein